jgi:hypothetical protein
LNRQSLFERLLSLLQGVAWALVFVGFISSFLTFYHLGLFVALIGAFMGALVGLFFVAIFEIAQVQIDKLKELKKQTKLLEKLTISRDETSEI